MSDILRQRGELLKKLNVMVRKIEAITTFVLFGEKDCPATDVRLTAAGKADELEQVFADLHFLVGEFLAPQTSDKTEEDGRTVAAYRFDSGLSLKIFLCAEDNLPSCDWWLPYLDRHGAAEDYYLPECKVGEDPARDLPVAEPVEPSETELPQAEEVSPVPEPVVPAEEAPAEKPSAATPLTWEAVYEKINLAKHAVAGGSVIYAAELMNELRTALIELICRKNGVTENFVHSIDLLSGEEKDALRGTYPTRLESGAMVAALAAELKLFEKLMR